MVWSNSAGGDCPAMFPLPSRLPTLPGGLFKPGAKWRIHLRPLPRRQSYRASRDGARRCSRAAPFETCARHRRHCGGGARPGQPGRRHKRYAPLLSAGSVAPLCKARVRSYLTLTLVLPFSLISADLDVEALTKAVLDLSRDLDQYLQSLLLPEPLPLESLKEVGR
jgi:hypothetical protein